jgi:hypothetical protein
MEVGADDGQRLQSAASLTPQRSTERMLVNINTKQKFFNLNSVITDRGLHILIAAGLKKL